MLKTENPLKNNFQKSDSKATKMSTGAEFSGHGFFNEVKTQFQTDINVQIATGQVDPTANATPPTNNLEELIGMIQYLNASRSTQHSEEEIESNQQPPQSWPKSLSSNDSSSNPANCSASLSSSSSNSSSTTHSSIEDENNTSAGDNLTNMPSNR